MISVNAANAWLSGNNLVDFETGQSVRLSIADVTHELLDDHLDHLESGADDLRVVHLAFRGDPVLLQFLNRCIAERFDLPTRVVRVQFGEERKSVVGKPARSFEAAHQILDSVGPVHFTISRPLWLQWRLEHAAKIAAREVRLAAYTHEREAA